ncbi:MAG: hypothetical protein HOV92_27165 [Streptomyces sp.]|nr:hypothetical protein [Streptomyces sp.]
MTELRVRDITKSPVMGVVSRGELLQALVRDDEVIRAGVVARGIDGELHGVAAGVHGQVKNGTVNVVEVSDRLVATV